jgi:hypothetical protein
MCVRFRRWGSRRPLLVRSETVGMMKQHQDPPVVAELRSWRRMPSGAAPGDKVAAVVDLDISERVAVALALP